MQRWFRDDTYVQSFLRIGPNTIVITHLNKLDIVWQNDMHH